MKLQLERWFHPCLVNVRLVLCTEAILHRRVYSRCGHLTDMNNSRLHPVRLAIIRLQRGGQATAEEQRITACNLLQADMTVEVKHASCQYG